MNLSFGWGKSNKIPTLNNTKNNVKNKNSEEDHCFEVGDRNPKPNPFPNPNPSKCRRIKDDGHPKLNFNLSEKFKNNSYLNVSDDEDSNLEDKKRKLQILSDDFNNCKTSKKIKLVKEEEDEKIKENKIREEDEKFNDDKLPTKKIQ